MSTEIKPYSFSELSNLYEVSKKTMRTWLKPHLPSIGKKVGRYYNVLQIKIIFEKLGAPEKITPGIIAFLYNLYFSQTNFYA